MNIQFYWAHHCQGRVVVAELAGQPLSDQQPSPLCRALDAVNGDRPAVVLLADTVEAAVQVRGRMAGSLREWAGRNGLPVRFSPGLTNTLKKAFSDSPNLAGRA